MPLGITVAKVAKHTPLWNVAFYLHVGLQTLGLVMAIAAGALGSQLTPKQGSAHRHVCAISDVALIKRC